jgi:hypothetical protein
MASNSKRRLVTFQNELLSNNDYKDWVKRVDDFNVMCKYCKQSFTIKYEGVGALKAHLNSDKHKKSALDIKCN